MNEENKPKLIVPKGNDSFAQVELFLWQYGELPKENETRKIEIDKALMQCSKNIMEAVKKKDMNNMVNPMMVASVLEYLADNYSFEN